MIWNFNTSLILVLNQFCYACLWIKYSPLLKLVKIVKSETIHLIKKKKKKKNDLVQNKLSEWNELVYQFFFVIVVMSWGC